MTKTITDIMLIAIDSGEATRVYKPQMKIAEDMYKTC